MDHPAVQNVLSRKGFVSVGFTLTGRDDLEPGASTNRERIQSMKELHNAGISTWASIEPIIDPDLSFEMIRETAGFCDHYKIGILSGKKGYTPQQIRDFVAKVQSLGHTSIYWLSLIHIYINKIQILSGDKQAIVTNFAEKLGIAQAYGNLLPDEKVKHIEELLRNANHQVAFVGDGINDAPVLALSNVCLLYTSGKL